VRPSTEAERRRLNERFAALCVIPSPSGHEGAITERVEAELRTAGWPAQRDATGNLLARRDPRHEHAVLLCAHLDTVPHGDTPIEPVLVDDAWTNRHDAILGADNKAAIAVLLAVAERIAIEGAPIDVELLFTVGEEQALAGAKAFDTTTLRATIAYVFDHATPIGEIVAASPTYYRLEAHLRGLAAHAGIRPQDGRSAIVAAARAIAAMPLGRIDAQTTANVGWIGGGPAGATNVVP
jgi:tripeptide aminopeptidase